MLGLEDMVDILTLKDKADDHAIALQLIKTATVRPYYYDRLIRIDVCYRISQKDVDHLHLELYGGEYTFMTSTSLFSVIETYG